MKSLLTRLAFFTSLLALTVLPADADAGPWTKSTGEYYVKVGQSFYRATEFRTAGGVLLSGRDYVSSTSYVYGEVGVWRRLHLQAYVPLMYSRVSVGPLSESDFGPGDALVSVQHSPLELPFPTSLRLEARVPLYGEPATPQTPARGDGQFDFALWLSAGGGLTSIPLYFYVDLGYQHRTSLTVGNRVVPEFSDGLLTLAQVGYNVADTFIVALTTSGVMPFTDDAVSEGYLTVGPSVFWPVTDLLALEVDGYLTPYARNSAHGWALGFGVSFRGE